jgi:hypothetical protein
MKFFYKCALLICFAGTGSFVCVAQSNTMGWLASFNTVKLNDKWSVHTDVQLRSTHGLAHMNQVLLRPGINYQLNKKMIVSAGYAYTHVRGVVAGESGYIPDHRIWEQFIYNHRIKSIYTQHRFRLEQRFLTKPVLDNGKIKGGKDFYANRFRYFIRNILPLQKQAAFTKGAFVALQNEVFLNFGNTENLNGKLFDQNRVYGAAGYRFSKAFDVEAGYMYQYVQGRNSVTNNNIIQVATYLRL